MFNKFINYIKLDKTTILILIAILSFKSFAYNPSYVPTGSMIPTIDEKSFILVDVHSYGIKIPFTKIELLKTGHPERGDIAVFRMPLDERTNYVKRIVAVAGDTVYFNDDSFKINEVPTDMPNMKKAVVPVGYYFAIGDNINHSYDSRFWGYVPEANLVGKYVTTLLSLNKILPQSDKPAEHEKHGEDKLKLQKQ